jgi:hypothetical protein
MLAIATVLLLIMGIAHSYLGERYILIRLSKRENLPKVLGSVAFTVGTLRFVWHLTTVAWGALALLVFSAGYGAVAKDQVLTIIGFASLGSAAFPLYFTRGKHLSWVVFIVVGVLVLASRSSQ